MEKFASSDARILTIIITNDGKNEKLHFLKNKVEEYFWGTISFEIKTWIEF